MGRRKRRKVIKPKPLSMPKVYQCPRCGAETLSISFKKLKGEPFTKLAIIKCGTCKLYLEMKVPEVFTEIDVYGKIVDLANEGRLEEMISEPTGLDEEE
ncbi:MAG: hypothetical protein LRS47_02990 [Desulfurococcales archaeon]|nr:hypothetical protein [Desulfurococcales archaeon]